MIGKDRHAHLWKILIFLNLCFIWGNSLLPAEISQSFSDWIKSLLETAISGGETGSSGSGLLRKAAHFTEFAVLGLLLSQLFRVQRKRCLFVLPWGAAAACIDEAIQFFVPGRSPGILDVGIDSCGVLTGMILLQIGYFLWKQIQSKRYGGKQ